MSRCNILIFTDIRWPPNVLHNFRVEVHTKCTNKFVQSAFLERHYEDSSRCCIASAAAAATAWELGRKVTEGKKRKEKGREGEGKNEGEVRPAIATVLAAMPELQHGRVGAQQRQKGAGFYPARHHWDRECGCQRQRRRVHRVPGPAYSWRPDDGSSDGSQQAREQGS
jgi:hypothetical protein